MWLHISRTPCSPPWQGGRRQPGVGLCIFKFIWYQVLNALATWYCSAYRQWKSKRLAFYTDGSSMTIRTGQMSKLFVSSTEFVYRIPTLKPGNDEAGNNKEFCGWPQYCPIKR